MKFVEDLWRRHKSRHADDDTPPSVQKIAPEETAAAQPRFKVNPFVNFLMRASGEWPIAGPPPLSEAQYRQLFATAPSFADYFPVVDYLDEDEAYLFDDGLNVARFWKVESRYMCARSKASLARFNQALTAALNALPGGEEYPYICQVFLRSQAATSIADDLEAAMRENGVLDDPYSQAILEVNRRHAELVSHPNGIFPDSRLPGADQGWRVNDLSVYLCIYRKAPEKFWKKEKRSPAAQSAYDLTTFITAMQTAGVGLKLLLPHELVSWLAPYFGHETVSRDAMAGAREMASFDLGQMIFQHQPVYHRSKDPREQGIWRFGDKWLRYLTLGAVERPPREGTTTLGEQHVEGNRHESDASLFEKMPTGSMMAWSIVPRSETQIKAEINQMLYQSENGASREAKFATDQAQKALDTIMRSGQRIFYLQTGIYLQSHSLAGLLDATEQAATQIRGSNCLSLIEPRYDLISQDSFVRSLPTVYDFSHDRNAALRARKTYTAHLAALLPFYGNKSGSNHPCYVMYSRTGEPFYLNPFHQGDRVKVSHELFFGPSGSGKSASIVYMAMQSMAVNNPRMFIFDYGNSFKLLADYMERYGKKVKRIVLDNSSDEVLAPFFETKKALAEAEEIERINRGEWTGKGKKARVSLEKSADNEDIAETAATSSQDDDEERSYLAEMEYILRIMVTGGSDNVTLSQPQISRINAALVRGLRISQAKGERHARPSHMAQAMREMADEEARREGRLEEIAVDLRNMADAIELWTTGLRGKLFNRHAEGFSADYDLTVIELGALGKKGSEDMLAVAGLSAIYTIIALAEKLQGSGRAIEVKIDEAHLWAHIKLLMGGLVTGAKVFRKLGCWLNVITQDISDFADTDAQKILGNAEFWWLMRLDEKEINQASTVLNLSDEARHLIQFLRKEERRFVEGVSLSEKFDSAMVRFVPPSLMLALGQTDGKEKEVRYRLMREKGIEELDAALLIAEEIEKNRRKYQERQAA